MLRGIFFDMDGVLFDTERVSVEIGEQLLQEMGYGLQRPLLLQCCGANSAFIEQRMQARLGPGFCYETYAQQMHRRMCAKLDADGMPKMAGVDTLLPYLRREGYRVAIASSTRYEDILRYIQAANIAPFFDEIVGGDMVAASKPAPDIYLAAARALGLPPSLCAAVEDSHNGVRSAAAAGCVTLMVPDLLPATPELEALVAAVLPSLLELPAFLEQWNRQHP